MDILTAFAVSTLLRAPAPLACEGHVQAQWHAETTHGVPYSWGARLSVLRMPTYGAGATLFFGAGEYAKWEPHAELHFGVAGFTDPFPADGTSQNFLIGAKIGYGVTERISLYTEWRHISNGADILPRSPNANHNPGHDAFMLGVQLRLP